MSKYTPKNEKYFNKSVRDLLDARIYNNAKESERGELEEKDIIKKENYSTEELNNARIEKIKYKAMQDELQKIVFKLFKGRYE